MAYTPTHLSATGTVFAAPGPGMLGTVNVNTGASSAVVTIYNNTSAAGVVVATIDASAACTRVYACRLSKGITWVLSGGNADVTVTAE